jgi:hypothetical protein
MSRETEDGLVKDVKVRTDSRFVYVALGVTGAGTALTDVAKKRPERPSARTRIVENSCIFVFVLVAVCVASLEASR